MRMIITLSKVTLFHRAQNDYDLLDTNKVIDHITIHTIYLPYTQEEEGDEDDLRVEEGKQKRMFRKQYSLSSDGGGSYMSKEAEKRGEGGLCVVHVDHYY